jgi:kynurenine formamidase
MSFSIEAELELGAGMIAEHFSDLASRLCNWGRWGPDDELGTVNYITAAKVAAAGALVRRGQVFALGIPLAGGGPQQGRSGRFDPIHVMTALPADHMVPDGTGTSDDVLLLPTQAGTQWDGLAHKSHRGLLYGGRPHDLVASGGAAVNSIQAVSGRIVTRGVLVDMPRFRDVAALAPGDEITASDLADALRYQGTDAGAGDIMLVRTGHLERCRAQRWQGYYDAAPGLGLDTLEWIHGRRLAGVAADTGAVEVRPSRVAGVKSPFHVIGLVYMGLLIGEIFDLEDLSAACQEEGVYDFLLVGAPLPIAGGVASPVNPYAVR